MFKKETKKSKKISLFALTTGLSLASLASVVTATSCSQTNKSSNDNASPLNSYSMYSKITFVAPASPAGVTFSGSTIVKIKTGHMFGTVSHPTPVLSGYECMGWKNADTDATVSPETKIIADIRVEPVMAPIGSNVIINGRSEIYSGFVIDQEGNLQTNAETEADNAYTYEVVTSQQLLATDVVTLTVDSEHTSDVTITQDAGDKKKFYIKPAFTEEPIGTLEPEGDEPAHPIVLTATITRNGTTIGTATHNFVIRPPYYYTEDVTFTSPEAEESTTLDLGNVYWTVYDLGAAGSGKYWLCATPEGMCLDDEALAEDDPIQYYQLSNILNDKPGYIIEMQREGWIGMKDALSDIYPGAEINHIHDEFLAETTNYNPELHGGIHEINMIGNSFMRGCTEFNQDISDLFDTIAPVTIGDYFLAGCAGFNNGVEYEQESTFVMPNAITIGHGFMSDCESLLSDIEIDPTTEHIGNDFMADCMYVKSLTIPSTSKLEYFGTNIMTNCYSLESIEINTADIMYLQDFDVEPEQVGSFTVEILPEDEDAVVVTGANADAILALYPNVTTGYGPYRLLVKGA